MADLEKMRALLAQEEEKSKKRNPNGSGHIGDGPVYPHWSIPLDSIAVVRFLPDGDDNNPFFWAERSIRKLPFTAVKGVDLGNKTEVEVQVPDLDKFQKGLDPVQRGISSWWDEGRHDEYRVYKKKMSYLYQGFVRTHPGFVDRHGNPVEPIEPENPIRRFILAPKIHETIKAIIMNPKVKNSPVDFENGRDFEIHLRKQGQHNNYDASQWSFEEDALSVTELEAIEKFGLCNLGEFVPQRPSDEAIRAIEEMFEASVAGLPFEPDRWAEHYRPAGVDLGSSASGEGGVTSTKTAEKEPEVEGNKTADLLAKLKKTETAVESSTESSEEETPPFDVEEKEPAEEVKTEKKSSSTADLLAKLKARQQG